MISHGSTAEMPSNVADLGKSCSERQVSVFSELTREDQARIINGVFVELKNSFPGSIFEIRGQDTRLGRLRAEAAFQ